MLKIVLYIVTDTHVRNYMHTHTHTHTRARARARAHAYTRDSRYRESIEIPKFCLNMLLSYRIHRI